MLFRFQRRDKNKYFIKVSISDFLQVDIDKIKTQLTHARTTLKKVNWRIITFLSIKYKLQYDDTWMNIYIYIYAHNFEYAA